MLRRESAPVLLLGTWGPPKVQVRGERQARRMTLSGKGIAAARQLWKVLCPLPLRGGTATDGATRGGFMVEPPRAISQVDDRDHGQSFGMPVFHWRVQRAAEHPVAIQ